MTYIEVGTWPQMQAGAQRVRTAVFVQEQGISPEDEWDQADDTAIHAVLFDCAGQALGNARLILTAPHLATVGRMAVLADARGQGHGSRLLKALLRCAQQQGCKEVHLSAQYTAETFYAAHGFVAVGQPYDDVGIPHVAMRLSLNGLNRMSE